MGDTTLAVVQRTGEQHRPERLLASLLHPTRFERWPTLQPFEPRDLLALGCHRLLQTRHLAQQPDDKRLQLSRGECVQVIRGSHPSRESEVGASGKRKQHCRHRFCRCYRLSTLTRKPERRCSFCEGW